MQGNAIADCRIVSTLSGLALHMPIEDLMIPPSAYLCDRRISPAIHAPYASGRRAFGVKEPLPLSSDGGHRLPRVLREATSFILMDDNIKIEGLFRIPPSAITLDILREAFDRGQKFIMWHESNETIIFYRSEHSQMLSDALSQPEGYGVHAAAGLIKLWYRELAQPIIPPSAYRPLKDIFGDLEKPIDPERVIQLVSITSEWSPLPETSRLILTKHLLPLLSRVTDFQTWNLMTPYNLAVCFAPSLLRGPDPIEDAQMSSVVTRILEAAIPLWKTTLAPLCHMDHFVFEDSLRVPFAIEDYEDPLEELPTPTMTLNADFETSHLQENGITLVDNDHDTDPDDNRSDAEDFKPPLPPRPGPSNSDVPGASTTTPVVRRKPAPPLDGPPRYSMVVADGERVPEWTSSPTMAESGGGSGNEQAQIERDQPDDSATGVVARKPVPKGF